MSSIHIQSYTGSATQPFLTELARLRIEVFRDFPYLYEGNMAYEREYLQTFFEAPDSLLVVATAGDQVVGASTGVPLMFETPDIQQPWRDKGYDIQKIFYYGESVLQKAYRGRGVGVRFFEERERWARQLGRFEIAAFCGVVRPEDHPLWQADYVPLDGFWERRGFSKTEDLICYISWKDLDEAEASPKPLHFWYKKLR